MKASKKRTFWTSQEDIILSSMVKDWGTKKWKIIADFLTKKYPENPKNGKQCRQRWINKLNPQVKKCKWQKEQTQKLLDLHAKYGNQWLLISKQLPGRTQNTVKNKFFSIVRKKLRNILKMCNYHKTTEKIIKIKPSFICNVTTSCIKNSNSTTEMLNQNEEELDVGISWFEVGQRFYQKVRIQQNESLSANSLLKSFKLKLKQEEEKLGKQRVINILRQMLYIYDTLFQTAKLIPKSSSSEQSSVDIILQEEQEFLESYKFVRCEEQNEIKAQFFDEFSLDKHFFLSLPPEKQ